MKYILICLVFSFCLFTASIPLKAETQFGIYLNEFYKKQEMASQILKELESEMKNGSKAKICARQKEAANYGIEATESLIKAFKISGTPSNFNDIQAGLNKWKELKVNC